VSLTAMAKDVEQAFEGSLVLILDARNLSAGRGENRVNKATLEEGYIDSHTRHEIDKVLVGDFELVFICNSHVFDNALSLQTSQHDSKLIKVLLDATLSHVLCWHDVLFWFILAHLLDL